jgi:hypothetical protein
MIRWIPLYLGLLAAQFIADLEVTTLSVDAAAFKSAFNASSDRPRVIALFSPT